MGMDIKNRTTKEILGEIEANSNKIMEIQRSNKVLYKELEKSIKYELKDSSKRKQKSTNSEKREPSGFNAKQPVPIEFCCQPWGCTEDQQLARTTLTRMVYDYCRNNSLQKPSDKRVIFPDEHVTKLFHLKPTDTLHFNNFQSYMKRLNNRNFDDEITKDSSSCDDSLDEISDIEKEDEIKLDNKLKEEIEKEIQK